MWLLGPAYSAGEKLLFKSMKELLDYIEGQQKNRQQYQIEFINIWTPVAKQNPEVLMDTETGKAIEKRKFPPAPVPLGRSGEDE